MSGAEVGLLLSVFLACVVEAVEALTIVLAVGTTRSWSSTLSGVGVATFTLAVIVTTLGSALTSLPINVLRLVVGALLLIFGLQWLRKAILRGAGLKAKHDELETYEEEAKAARAVGSRPQGFDGYSFTIAFKGVLLEGLEVAFIVLTFGANQSHIGLAAAAAGLAVLAVVIAGAAARAPLARVPENTMKFAVGAMLTSFGMFWGAQGAGAHWPGGDAALLGIISVVLLAAFGMIGSTRRATHQAPVEQSEPTLANAGDQANDGRIRRVRVRAFLLAVWEFVVGDDWRTALGVVLALGLTALVADMGIPAWWVTLVAAIGLLAFSIRRASRSSNPPSQLAWAA